MIWLPATFFREAQVSTDRLGNPVTKPVKCAEALVRVSAYDRGENPEAGNRFTEGDVMFKVKVSLRDVALAAEVVVSGVRYKVLSVREASPRWVIVRAKAVKQPCG